MKETLCEEMLKALKITKKEKLPKTSRAIVDSDRSNGGAYYQIVFQTFFQEAKEKRAVDIIIESKNNLWLCYFAEYAMDKKGRQLSEKSIRRLSQFLVERNDFYLADDFAEKTPGISKEEILKLARMVLNSRHAGSVECFISNVSGLPESIIRESINIILKSQEIFWAYCLARDIKSVASFLSEKERKKVAEECADILIKSGDRKEIWRFSEFVQNISKKTKEKMVSMGTEVHA